MPQTHTAAMETTLPLTKVTARSTASKLLRLSTASSLPPVPQPRRQAPLALEALPARPRLNTDSAVVSAILAPHVVLAASLAKPWTLTTLSAYKEYKSDLWCKGYDALYL